MSTLPEPISPPTGPVLVEALNKILPEDVSLETLNSQYLQKHSTSAKAILASAQALRVLGSPLQEAEDLVLTTLRGEVQLDVKVGLHVVFLCDSIVMLVDQQTALEISAFLKKIKSARLDELHKALDTKFTVSSTFKAPEELAKLREWALTNDQSPTSNTGAATPKEAEADLGTA